jgi:hypothetical protein
VNPTGDDNSKTAELVIYLCSVDVTEIPHAELNESASRLASLLYYTKEERMVYPKSTVILFYTPLIFLLRAAGLTLFILIPTVF